MKPNITLRPAIAADQAVIIRLVIQNNLNPLGLSWQNFIVAVDKEDQFLGCGQIKNHGDIEELASLVVVQEWQGHGVSTVLMDALIKRAKRPLWLMCESPLVSYYDKFGFSEVKEPIDLPSYFRNVYWASRFSFGFALLLRGTYVAFMVLHANKQT